MEIELIDILLKICFLSLVVFGVLMFVMVVFFGISAKDALTSGKNMVGILIISLGLPLAIWAVNSNLDHIVRASGSARIANLEVLPVDAKSQDKLVSFDTEGSVLCFLEYKLSTNEYVPILPTSDLVESAKHTFIVDSKSFPDVKRLYVNIKGKRSPLKSEI